jgi:hypothetical protein
VLAIVVHLIAGHSQCCVLDRQLLQQPPTPKTHPRDQDPGHAACVPPLMQDMVVRGAPAIGVTGALALAVHLIAGGRGKQYSSVQACLDDITATMDYLVTRWVGLTVLACTHSRGFIQQPDRACSSPPAPLQSAHCRQPVRLSSQAQGGGSSSCGTAWRHRRVSDSSSHRGG